MIYLIVCLFIILLGYIEILENSRVSASLYGIVVAFIMVAMAALRTNVGPDWQAYYEFYIYGAEDTEAGYHFLNDLFFEFGIHYNVFLLFINTLSLILIYLGLQKHAKFLIFPILLFYCELFLYFNFSGIRQALAISLTIYSTRFIITRSFWKFLTIVVLATYFHNTAIVFIIAYFIPFRKLTKKEYFILLLGFLLFSTLIFSIVNLLSGSLAAKAIHYLEFRERDPNIKGLFVIGAIKRTMIIVLVLFFGKKMLEAKNSIFFFNIYLIGFGMYLATYLISADIGVRLSSYFLIFDLFLAGNLLSANYKLTTRLLIATILSLIALYKITTYMAMETYTYHWIF